MTEKPLGVWLQEDDLLYRLAETPYAIGNCDAIQVLQVNGSCAIKARAARATELMALLSDEPLIDLLREARDELLWWIDEHGCCAGHEGDLIDRIDAVIPEPKD